MASSNLCVVNQAFLHVTEGCGLQTTYLGRNSRFRHLMDARAVLFSTATAEQINEYVPSPFWKRVIELWKAVTKANKLVTEQPGTSEELMAIPSWFCPLHRLRGLEWKTVEMQRAVQDSARDKWDPIALMQYHTLRDWWDEAEQQWVSAEGMIETVAAAYFRTSEIEELEGRIRSLRNEFVNSMPPAWTKIAQGGRTPFSVGDMVEVIENGVEYGVITAMEEAVYYHRWVRHPEGFLTPTSGPKVGITSRAHLGHPIIYHCQRFKRVTSMGLSETMWPQPHQATLTKDLAAYEKGKTDDGRLHKGAVVTQGSRDFYSLLVTEPSGPDKAPSYRPNKVILAWQEELGHTEAAIARAVCSNTRLRFALLPSEKIVFLKLMRKGHITGSRNGDQAMRKCQVGCTGCTDNHEHAFYECKQTKYVWEQLLQIFDSALPGNCNALARSTVRGADMAFCLAGLRPSGELAPQWWLLIQRITARWIWVRYTDMKYGKHALSSKESVVSHVLKEVKFRLVTMWNEAHSSVVSRVSLKVNSEEGGTKSLKETGGDFSRLFGPIVTLKRNAVKNAGIKGEKAMELSRDFTRALKQGNQ